MFLTAFCNLIILGDRYCRCITYGLRNHSLCVIMPMV